MAVGIRDPGRVRAGWSVPVVGLGIVVGAAGLLVRHDAGPTRTLCHVNAQVQAFMRSVSAKAGSLPGLPTKSASCADLDLRYDLGLVGALLGLAIAVAGVVWLVRRSRRAARSGAPWPIRRTLDATARWLGARLPGNQHAAQPRLRGGFLAGLAMVLVVFAVGGALSVWNSYQRSAQLHGYETATTALIELQLPHELHREPAANCPQEPVCARSSLNPPQVEPILRHLLNGAPNPALTASLPGQRRLVVVFGSVVGGLGSAVVRIA